MNMIHRHTLIRALALVTSLAAVPLLAGCEQAGLGASSEASRSELEARLRAGLEERLRGPSTDPGAGGPRADAGAGVPSMFTPETADALRSVAVDSAGHATVDFHDLRPLIPNASASAASTLLLRELNAAVFRFPEIHSVEYRMEGSCDLFWEWLQYGCHIVTMPPNADWRTLPQTDLIR